jgi:hypothetical protein
LKTFRKISIMKTLQLKAIFSAMFLLLFTCSVNAALQCNEADKEGWTNQLPTPYDPSSALTSPNQKGSRIIYISASSGNDETGEFYFWDGSRVVDSKGRSRNSHGREYGANPNHPTSAVRAFKHWAAVAPRTDGGDLLSKNPIFGSTPLTRAGYPDWWLFARNETFDIAADFRAVVPNSVAGPNFVASLAISGGRSATEPQVVTAYGSLCLPRPRFVNPVLDFVLRFESKYAPTFRNVLYSSLHFDGRGTKESTSSLLLLGQTVESRAIVFEDMWFDAAYINIGQNNEGEITIRRSLLTDVHSTTGKTNAEGIFYAGGPQGIFRIEESILMRNGFRGDPKNFAWPPNGDQVWNIFNRNMYMAGKTQSTRSGFFDSISMMGASGDQFRPGMRVERSFFYQGYVMLGGGGGRPDADGSSGAIIDNVLQRFEGSGTNDNRGQPGWGFEITWGANDVQVSGNIVSGAQHPAKSYALKFSPFDLCPYVKPTRNNRVFGNVFDSGSATSAILSADGVSYPQGCAQPWSYPGIVNNAVYDNVLINSGSRQHVYVPKEGALGTSSNTSIGTNKVLVDRNQGIAQLNWKDPNRTLRTYLSSKGVTVSSEDGFPEYFQIATKMQRGLWNTEWTARNIVNYFRAGFEKPLLY